MPQPHRNRLLAAIPQRSRKQLLSNSAEIVLSPKDVLHESDAHPSHVFFLTSGLASIFAVTEAGIAAEVGVIGREGFSGSLHLIGPVDAPTHCRMQLSGAAVRIPYSHLEKTFREDEHFHLRVLEFVQAQAHNLSQLSGCHSIHGASERLTRWLLTAQGLTESSTIDITQEGLSELLGTKRVTIAAAASKLKRKKLISYSRGRINVLNRKGLESLACDCYATVREIHKGLYQ